MRKMRQWPRSLLPRLVPANRVHDLDGDLHYQNEGPLRGGEKAIKGGRFRQTKGPIPRSKKKQL